MILPNTPLYQAKTDAEFRIRMIHEIKKQYKDVLGNDAKLLDLPNGLDLVQSLITQRLYEMSHDIGLRREEIKSIAAYTSRYPPPSTAPRNATRGVVHWRKIFRNGREKNRQTIVNRAQ
jgi:hypothetical protein